MKAASRRRAYEILDVGRPDDPPSRLADIALIALISLNVLAVILETLPALANPYGAFFEAFETFSVTVFSVEYVLRVWSAVEDEHRDYRHPVRGRLRYMLSPMALIDLVAILPFYLGFFVDFDLRFMRVLRLLRVFKLTRYSSSMSLLLQVLREVARSIGAAFFVMMLMIVLAASFTYLAEHDAQPEVFGSIPEAMWWAIITMTTVGYGDVVPVTPLGKVFGALIGIVGIGMVALPAGLLASGFTEALRRRRREYEAMVEDALEDGILTEEEEALLKKTQESLGLDADEARAILHLGIDRKRASSVCPHCGKPIHDRRAADNGAGAFDDQ